MGSSFNATGGDTREVFWNGSLDVDSGGTFIVQWARVSGAAAVVFEEDSSIHLIEI